MLGSDSGRKDFQNSVRALLNEYERVDGLRVKLLAENSALKSTLQQHGLPIQGVTVNQETFRRASNAAPTSTSQVLRACLCDSNGAAVDGPVSRIHTQTVPPRDENTTIIDFAETPHPSRDSESEDPAQPTNTGYTIGSVTQGNSRYDVAEGPGSPVAYQTTVGTVTNSGSLLERRVNYGAAAVHAMVMEPDLIDSPLPPASRLVSMGSEGGEVISGRHQAQATPTADLIQVVSKKVWMNGTGRKKIRVSFSGLGAPLQDGDLPVVEPRHSLGASANRLATTAAQNFKTKARVYSIFGAHSHSNGGSTVNQETELRLHDRWTELLILNEREAEEDLIQYHREMIESDGVKAHSDHHFLSQPSNSTISSYQKKPRHWLLSPASLPRQFWDVIGFCLIAYDVIMIPFVLAWNKKETVGSPLFSIFIVSLVYWSLNVPMNFCTAVVRDGQIKYDAKLVAKYYCRHSLLLDLVVAGLDWSNFLVIIGGEGNAATVRQLRVLRVGRMFRAVKIRDLYNSIEETLVSRGWQSLTILMSIFTIGATILATTHILACLMYFIGYLSRESSQSNWLDEFSVLELPPSYQYARSFHWVLCQFTPAPNPTQPQNETETITVIILIFVSLIMIGSSLARLNGAITLLKSKTAESELIKRQIQLYLKINKVSPDLSSRVMHCAEHVLKTRKTGVKKPEALSLLPSTIREELSMSQKGTHVMAHPLFALILTSRPGVAKLIVETSQPAFYEPNSVVFAEEKEAVCMYSLLQGKYRISHRLEELVAEASHPTRFSELALFTYLVHVKTVTAITFGDALTLPAEALAEVVKTCPLSILVSCEYAQAVFGHLASERHLGVHIDTDELPADLCEQAAWSTQLYGVVGKKFDEQFKEHRSTAKDSGPVRTSLVSSVSTSDSSLVQGIASAGSMTPTSSHFGHSLAMRIASKVSHNKILPVQELLDEVQEEKYLGKIRELMDVLSDYLPELHRTDGIYAKVDHSRERERAALACCSALWTIAGQYDDICAGQPEAKRLSPEMWEELMAFVSWCSLDEDTIVAGLVFLTLRGLGKSKKFLRLCPITARREREDAVVALIDQRQVSAALLPSVGHLSREQLSKVKAALHLSAEFNFGQFVQGECVPERVNELSRAMREHGEDALKFYLVTSMWMMCGVTGTDNPTGSLFLNEANATMLLLAFHCLRQCGTWDSGTIYWSYIASRGTLLQFQMQTDDPQTLALSRLVCMTRAQDAAGKESLVKVWQQLSSDERQALTMTLLADGIDHQAFVFVFLPAFLDNAKANTDVTLKGGLLCLLKIVEMLYAHKSMSRTWSQTVLVDLSDAVRIMKIACSLKALDDALEQSKLLQNENRIWIVMTARSWDVAQVVRKRSDPLDILVGMVQEVSQKQAMLEQKLAGTESRSLSAENGPKGPWASL